MYDLRFTIYDFDSNLKLKPQTSNIKAANISNYKTQHLAKYEIHLS